MQFPDKIWTAYVIVILKIKPHLKTYHVKKDTPKFYEFHQCVPNAHLFVTLIAECMQKIIEYMYKKWISTWSPPHRKLKVGGNVV